MENEIKKVIAAAKELSLLMSAHPVTRRYEENLSAMQQDAKSMDLLNRLVSAGKRLHDKAQSGGQVRLDDEGAGRRLQAELAENSLVKEFISSQKEYLKLVQTVIEKIRNPDDI